MQTISIWFLLTVTWVAARPDECEPVTPDSTTQEYWNNQPGRPTIVVNAPKLSEAYYIAFWDEIVNFQVQYGSIWIIRIAYARAVVDNPSSRKDNFLLAADKDTLAVIKSRLPSDYHDILIESNTDDIWMRDFSPISMTNQVKFKYAADYIPKQEDRDIIQNSFLKFLSNNGAYPYSTSPRKLDGGNVVDNFELAAEGMAVVTERFCKDNNVDCSSAAGKEAVRAELRAALGYAHVALVLDQGDTTGHSDGMVSFLGPATLGYYRPETAAQTQGLLNELNTQLPGIKLVEFDSLYAGGMWNGFTSACGLHVNALSTFDQYYVPVFAADPENRQRGQHAEIDATVVNTIKQNTCKKVIPVEVPYKVCRMGGSVRCLSYQVVGDIADSLILAARANA